MRSRNSAAAASSRNQRGLGLPEKILSVTIVDMSSPFTDDEARKEGAPIVWIRETVGEESFAVEKESGYIDMCETRIAPIGLAGCAVYVSPRVRRPVVF